MLKEKNSSTTKELFLKKAMCISEDTGYFFNL